MDEDNATRLGKFAVRIYTPSKTRVPVLSEYFLSFLASSLSLSSYFTSHIFTAADNYEMVKALYDFKATFAKTLSFREGEYFILLQRNVKQKNWWQVVNRGGRLGYIPSNYVASVKVGGTSRRDVYEHCIVD